MSETQILPFTVLVVEDNHDFAENLLTTLEMMGIQAHHADNAQDAIAFLNEHMPDLILLDLSLRGVSGWQVLECVQQKYGKHRVPVIVSTGKTDNMNRIVGRLQSVQSYLVKPFSTQDLFHAVNDVLELYKFA